MQIRCHNELKHIHIFNYEVQRSLVRCENLIVSEILDFTKIDLPWAWKPIQTRWFQKSNSLFIHPTEKAFQLTLTIVFVCLSKFYGLLSLNNGFNATNMLVIIRLYAVIDSPRNKFECVWHRMRIGNHDGWSISSQSHNFTLLKI